MRVAVREKLIVFVSRRGREAGVDERVGVGVVDLVLFLEAVVVGDRHPTSRVKPELLRVREDVGVGDVWLDDETENIRLAVAGGRSSDVGHFAHRSVTQPCRARGVGDAR